MNLVDTPLINKQLKCLNNIITSEDTPFGTFTEVDINLSEFKSQRKYYRFEYLECVRILRIIGAMYHLHYVPWRKLPYETTLRHLVKDCSGKVSSEEYEAHLYSDSDDFLISREYLHYKCVEYIAEIMYKYCVPLDEAIFILRRELASKKHECYIKWQLFADMCEKYKDYNPNPEIPFKSV